MSRDPGEGRFSKSRLIKRWPEVTVLGHRAAIPSRSKPRVEDLRRELLPYGFPPHPTIPRLGLAVVHPKALILTVTPFGLGMRSDTRPLEFICVGTEHHVTTIYRRAVDPNHYYYSQALYKLRGFWRMSTSYAPGRLWTLVTRETKLLNFDRAVAPV